MGIQMILSPTGISTATEKIVDKIRICYEAVKFFEGSLFTPKSIEVWSDASSEALGGRPIRVINISNLYSDTNTIYDYLSNLPFTELNRTIIVYFGTWHFDDNELGGYFSVQNQEDWKKTYGDLIIATYAKQFEDIVDGLWSLENTREIILKFVKSVAAQNIRGHLKPAQISFSRGLYHEEKPTNLMALYLSGERRTLLKIFYKALLATNDESILLKAKPLETRFFLDTLITNSIVTGRIDKRLEKELVDEIHTGSALYFGKNQDSFEKLFIELSNSVLRPAFSKLPKAEIVEHLIEDGINEYKDEDTESRN